MTDASRLQQVAKGRGVTMVLASAVPDHVPDVVVRRIEDPVPMMEIGLAWFDIHVSPFVPSFVDLAREQALLVSGEPRTGADPPGRAPSSPRRESDPHHLAPRPAEERKNPAGKRTAAAQTPLRATMFGTPCR